MNSTFWNELKRNYIAGGSTVKLIVWNSIIFLFIQLLLLFSRLSQNEDLNQFVFNFFTLNTNLSEFIYRPWGIITSFFSHFLFFHWLFNMLMLYFAGQLFERYFSSKKIVILYFLGGIFGGIFEILAHLFFPQISPVTSVVGASGSIMAIFIGLAFYKPQLKVSLFGAFELKIIYLAFIYLFYELISIGIPDGTAHFAHIGGAFIGWLVVKNVYSPTNLLNLIETFYSSHKRNKIRVKAKPVKKMSDEEFNYEKKKKQEKIDEILDKISKSGYDSLTKSEKEYLFSQSK
ncbi:MAG: rhomboid family intramembrane serine protease [Flavobacteriia bacterium]|nr:rhomboid family intramembrane serine protease [Flavobacteriia bacterium]